MRIFGLRASDSVSIVMRSGAAPVAMLEELIT